MRLLVTGASGFLGRNFLLASDSSWTIDAVYRNASDFPSFLTRHGLHHVVAHHADLSAAPPVQALAAGLPDRVDAILHLAANADPAMSVADPARDLLAGQLSLVNLLSAIACDRLLYMSSGAVYEGMRGDVAPEMPVAPCLPYAVSKLACERYVQWFHKTRRVGSYVILRFFAAYGPFEASRRICTRLVRWAAEGAREPFEIRGDGRNLMAAMYVGDAVRGIKHALTSTVSETVVDFCGPSLSINELVDRAVRILEVPSSRVTHVEAVAAEYQEFVASGKRMEQLFGFTPDVPLERGLVLLREHLAAAESCKA